MDWLTIRKLKKWGKGWPELEKLVSDLEARFVCAVQDGDHEEARRLNEEVKKAVDKAEQRRKLVVKDDPFDVEA